MLKATLAILLFVSLCGMWIGGFYTYKHYEQFNNMTDTERLENAKMLADRVAAGEESTEDMCADLHEVLHLVSSLKNKDKDMWAVQNSTERFLKTSIDCK